jgi:hypothetical protein
VFVHVARLASLLIFQGDLTVFDGEVVQRQGTGTRRFRARLRACLVVPGARLATHEFNPGRLQPDRIDDDLFSQKRPQVDGNEDFFGFDDWQLRNDARGLSDQQIRNPQS